MNKDMEVIEQEEISQEEVLQDVPQEKSLQEEGSEVDVELNKVVQQINYLLSVHNGLFSIVVGHLPDNKEYLVIEESKFLIVVDSLADTAKRLAESVGASIEEQPLEVEPQDDGIEDVEFIETPSQEVPQSETGDVNE